MAVARLRIKQKVMRTFWHIGYWFYIKDDHKCQHLQRNALIPSVTLHVGNFEPIVSVG
jgi:hypothetical protein